MCPSKYSSIHLYSYLYTLSSFCMYTAPWSKQLVTHDTQAAQHHLCFEYSFPNNVNENLQRVVPPVLTVNASKRLPGTSYCTTSCARLSPHALHGFCPTARPKKLPSQDRRHMRSGRRGREWFLRLFIGSPHCACLFFITIYSYSCPKLTHDAKSHFPKSARGSFPWAAPGWEGTRNTVVLQNPRVKGTSMSPSEAMTLTTPLIKVTPC